MKPPDWFEPPDRSDEVKSSGTLIYSVKEPHGWMMILAAYYGNITRWPMLGHDPPVAWREPSAWDPLMRVVVCPTIYGWALISPLAYGELAVLDAEPGQRP